MSTKIKNIQQVLNEMLDVFVHKQRKYSHLDRSLTNILNKKILSIFLLCAKSASPIRLKEL